MPRNINPAPIHFYQGKPLAGGKLYFYESGTNTDKATYKDSTLEIQNEQPVVLDAEGREPNVFYQGTAKQVLRTESGELVWEKDPTGGENLIGNWNDWNENIVYDEGDIVIGSDGKYYVSLTNNNIGNNPVTDELGNWEEVVLPSANVVDPVYTLFFRSIF